MSSPTVYIESQSGTVTDTEDAHPSDEVFASVPAPTDSKFKVPSVEESPTAMKEVHNAETSDSMHLHQAPFERSQHIISIMADSPRHLMKRLVHALEVSSSSDYALHSTSTPRQLYNQLSSILQRPASAAPSQRTTPTASFRKRLSVDTSLAVDDIPLIESSTSSSSVFLQLINHFIAYIALAVAVLSFSAIGPTFVYLEEHNVPPIIAVCWRSQTMLLCLLPFMIVEWFWYTTPAEKQWRTWYVPISPKRAALLRSSSKNPTKRQNIDQQQQYQQRTRVSYHNDYQTINQNTLELSNSSDNLIEMANIAQPNSNNSQHDIDAPTPRALQYVTEVTQRSPYKKPRTIQTRQILVESADSVLSPLSQRTPTHAASRHDIQLPTDVMYGWHALTYCFWLSISWGVSLSFWTTSLYYTSTARASLFASTYPLMLVFYLKYSGTNVSWQEFAGVFIAFSGILSSVAMSLARDEHTSHTASEKLIGDVLCLMTAVLVTFNCVASIRARRVMRLMTYTGITTFGLIVTAAVLAVVCEGATFTSTTDHHSLLGWLHPDMVYLIIGFGFVVGCIGFLGNNYAVANLPSIVFSSAQLLDPTLTAMMSYMAGIEGVPTVSTMFGGFVVTIGVAVVIVGEHRRQKREEQETQYATQQEAS